MPLLLDSTPADHDYLLALGRYPIGVGGVDCRLLHYHVLPAKQPSGGIIVQEDVAEAQDLVLCCSCTAGTAGG